MSTITKFTDQQRYQFLLKLLIDRGVITNRRYGDDRVWSLQGIYGTDDSGLRGLGASAEQAIDNAIVANMFDDDNMRYDFFRETYQGIVNE